MGDLRTTTPTTPTTPTTTTPTTTDGDGLLRALIGLETILVVGALAGGLGLVLDPTDGIAMGAELLDGTPFRSFLVPGFALLACNAVWPTVVAVATVRGQRWATTWGHVAVGAVLAGWIVVQVLLIGLVSWLQPAFLALGLVIMWLGIASRRRRSARWPSS